MTTMAEPQVQTEPTRRRFNVDEYMKMAEVGIFSKCGHVELIDGEILTKSPDSHPQCFTDAMLAVLPDPWFPPRHRFSVEDYYAMAEAGILGIDERVELIDGEIITMSPIGNEHAASVDSITDFLVPLVTGRAIVRVQAHLRLYEQNQPEPDLMILKRKEDYYRHSAPGPDDVLLIVEVSDTSLSHDRNVKLPLYARFGIPEVWIANIPARIVEVYRDPVDGEYTNTHVCRPEETVSPAAFDDVEIPVSQFIGAVSDEKEDNRPESG